MYLICFLCSPIPLLPRQNALPKTHCRPKICYTFHYVFLLTRAGVVATQGHPLRISICGCVRTQVVASFPPLFLPPSHICGSPICLGCFGTGPFQVYIMNWGMRNRLRSRVSKSLKYKRHVLYGWYCMEQAGGCSYHKISALSVD